MSSGERILVKGKNKIDGTYNEMEEENPSKMGNRDENDSTEEDSLGTPMTILKEEQINRLGRCPQLREVRYNTRKVVRRNIDIG